MVELNKFEESDLKEFEPDAKIGLISSISSEGFPHITFINTIMAKDSSQLMFGQFTEGQSKENLKNRSKAGFLIMTMEKKLWRGKLNYFGSKKEGLEYEKYNEKPMFRYSSYFGIHTIHYLNLVSTYGCEKLPIVRIGIGALKTKLFKRRDKTNEIDRVLNIWSENLFNKITALKFLSYLNNEGYPVIIPLLQSRIVDSRRVVFFFIPYKDELLKIAEDEEVCIIGLNMDMESVLVRGTFKGFQKLRFGKLGVVDINWVYNTMPPKPGQIYPPVNIDPVVDFSKSG